MNVVSAGPLIITLLGFVVLGVLLVVGLGYVLRPKTRARYPGGGGRYLLALTIQATAFILPLPFVMIYFWGAVMPGFDVVLAFLISLGIVLLLRYIPIIGPLLRDLTRARLETALERHPPFTKTDAP